MTLNEALRRREYLENQYDAVDTAVNALENAREAFRDMKGDFADHMLAIVSELHMEALAERAELNERLAAFEREDLAAQNREYERAV